MSLGDRVLEVAESDERAVLFTVLDGEHAGAKLLGGMPPSPAYTSTSAAAASFLITDEGSLRVTRIEGAIKFSVTRQLATLTVTDDCRLSGDRREAAQCPYEMQ